MNRNRVLIALAVAAALVLLFLLVRPNGDDEGAPTEPPSVEPIPTETGQTGTGPAQPDERRLIIRVANGRPVGGIQRLRVQQGERVIVDVRGGGPERVHVHGYDLMQDLTRDTPVRVAFDADMTGRFEIELEEAGRQIGELTVVP